MIRGSLSAAVAEVRARLAEGRLPGEVARTLVEKGMDPDLVQTALRYALEDQRYRPYEEWEVAVLRAAIPFLKARLVAAALGRTVGTVYKAVERQGIQRDRCTCGGRMEIYGLPTAYAHGGAGSLCWAVRCRKCGREVTYTLSWTEVPHAVEEPEGSSAPLAEATRC